jgi:hypothetical protein
MDIQYIVNFSIGVIIYQVVKKIINKKTWDKPFKRGIKYE